MTEQTERPKGVPMVDFPIISRVIDIAGDDWVVGSPVPAKFAGVPAKIVWMFYTDDPFDGIEIYARIDPKATDIPAKDRDNAFRFTLRQEHVRVVGEIMKVQLWKDVINEIIESIVNGDEDDDDEDDEDDEDESEDEGTSEQPPLAAAPPAATPPTAHQPPPPQPAAQQPPTQTTDQQVE